MNGARKVLVVALVLSFAVALFFPFSPSRSSSKQKIAIMTASLQSDDSQQRIVVIGGGLAGLCAAYEAARTVDDLGANASSSASRRGDASANASEASRGVHVLLLEKNDRIGGNSAKASSGINSVNPNAGDSASLFEQDTLKSGRGGSDAALVQALVAGAHGGPGGLVEFFSELGVELPSVTRLGGHSAARTRTTAPGSGVNVGLALVRAVEAALVRRHRARVSVVTGARVTRVERSGSGDDDAGRLLVTYEFNKGDGAGGSGGALNARPQAVVVAADALIIATGGFAASRELLARYAPPGVAELATTNGAWATGDGLALGTALGGVLRGMGDVQVHPTGFVDPTDPSAPTKVLAPERLRGCGAVLLDDAGRRFVDPLATRDVVAAAVAALPARSCWLVLGARGAQEFGDPPALAFYRARGLVAELPAAAAAAAHMGVGAAAASAALEEAVGPGPCWVGRVAPCVHYTQGGLAVGPNAQLLAAIPSEGGGGDGGGGGKLEAIPRVFAVGEVSGGLHGANRLAGNSLAECVVSGREAGRQAARAVCAAVSSPPPRRLVGPPSAS